MTKQKLNDLLDNLNAASEEDMEMLITLSRQYPYSQPLAILQAKIADKLNSANQKKYLSKAAIYAVDRNNLKQFIQEGKSLPGKKELEKRKVEEPITQNTSDRPVIPDPEKVNAQTETTANAPDASEEDSESSQIFKEVMENLNELKALRKKYEFLEKQEEQNKAKKNDEHSASNPPNEVQSSESTKEKEEDIKEENPDIHQIEKNEGPENTSEDIEQEEDKNKEDIPPHPETEPTDTDSNDHPDKLIQSYLDNEPNYALRRNIPGVEDEENKQDLSMKSASISDDIVSENLALLMINQGKTDKAIDIYKKLIWKFPQKKAYFASRIEELTKQK